MTNTFILGAFMIVACQRELAHQAPAKPECQRPRSSDLSTRSSAADDGHHAAAAGEQPESDSALQDTPSIETASTTSTRSDAARAARQTER